MNLRVKEILDSKIFKKIFPVIFIISLLGFFLNMYLQNQFYESYSKQKTEYKTKEIITHGTTYYVNEKDNLKYTIIGFVTWGLFIISILGGFILKLINDPSYFSRKKT